MSRIAHTAYVDNINESALCNSNYRQVSHTGKFCQSVYMSLEPGEDIPTEVHDVEQIIVVISGKADVDVNGEEFSLDQFGDMIIIPVNTRHYIKNGGNQTLKLWSIYTPKEHPMGRKDINQPLK